MQNKRSRLTESDLNRIVGKVLNEQNIPKGPYTFFTTPDKRKYILPGGNKLTKLVPKGYYLELNFSPAPGGGRILYDCSGVLKLAKGSNYAGYDTVKTVVYNDTLVTKLDGSKYCKGGSYNSGSLTKTDTDNQGLDTEMV
jgi:hypothetical protein